jgi:hypothetical protein
VLDFVRRAQVNFGADLVACMMKYYSMKRPVGESPGTSMANLVFLV